MAINLFVLSCSNRLDSAEHPTAENLESAENLTAENLEEVSQAVWMVKHTKSEAQGTGFFISENLFVTNLHVIDSFIKNNTFNDIYLEQIPHSHFIKIKRLLSLSVSLDFALMETETKVSSYLNLGKTAVRPKKPISMLGYPLEEGQLSHIKNIGQIKRFSNKLSFPTDHTFLSGASGSPVIDSKAQVIGMFSGGDFNFAYFVPVDLLNKFLPKNPNNSFCKDQSPKECLELAVQDFYNKTNQLSPYSVAYSYLYGIGVEKNEREAYLWMKKSAEQGLATAQYELALMYQYGKGTEKNESLAYQWMKKSAEQGLATAQYELSFIYWENEDKDKSNFWMKQSADQGHRPAQFRLRSMYPVNENQ